MLRETGLITTTRDGSSLVHDLTPLGRCLLDGCDPDRFDGRGA